MFYPHFQTPHLSLHRTDEFTNVYLSDGRDLLRENLASDASVLDCYHAVLVETAFLVFRDLVDLLPFMKPFGEHEWFALQQKDFYPIRHAAFLRGKIRFITLKDLKKITKKMWPHVEKNIKDCYPEQFPGKGKFAKVISCDWACLICPEGLHEDIYTHGKYGTTSTFNQDYLFEEAEKRGIVIDTLRRHPLELDITQKVIRDREKKIEEAKKSNGLIPPPEIPSKDSSEQKYGRLDLVAVKEQKRVRDELTFNRVKHRILQDSKISCYKVDNVAVDRHQYMAYIVWFVSEGNRITEVCQGAKGMPSLLEVYKWKQMYPDFALDLQIAEEIQAQQYSDQAKALIDSVTEKDEVPVAKFKHNALMSHAALQAEKFRQKQVIQTEDLDHKNVADLKRQLKVLLQGNMAHLVDVIDIEAIEQTEGQPLEEE